MSLPGEIRGGFSFGISMAFSYITYLGNGTQTDYTFPFLYIDTADIFVTVNTVVVSFTFINSSAIRCSSAPAAGSEVLIKRVTQKVSAPVNFTDGSVLLEKDLDTLVTYTQYIAQEQSDGAIDAYSLATMAGVYAVQAAASAAASAGSASSTTVQVSNATHASASKVLPVNADEIPLVDSESSSALTKLTWGNLKSSLKNLFDELYADKGSNTNITSMTALTDVPNVISMAISGMVNIYRGSLSGFYSPATTSTSIPISALGTLTQTSPSLDGQVYALPSLTSVNVVGDCLGYWIYNTGGSGPYAVTLKANASENILSIGNQFKLYPREWVYITNQNSSQWNVIGNALAINRAKRILQDVTASRTIGTTYTNSSDDEIVVSVVFAGGVATAATLVVAGLVVCTTYVPAGFTSHVSGTVGPGETYSVPGSNNAISKWTERKRTV